MRMSDFMPAASYEQYKEEMTEKQKEYKAKIEKWAQQIEEEENEFPIPKDELRDIWKAPIEDWERDRHYIDDRLKRAQIQIAYWKRQRYNKQQTEQEALTAALAKDAVPTIKSMAKQQIERKLKD